MSNKEKNLYLIYDTKEADALLGTFTALELCDLLKIQRGSLYKSLSRTGMIHRRYYVVKADDVDDDFD